MATTTRRESAIAGSGAHSPPSPPTSPSSYSPAVSPAPARTATVEDAPSEDYDPTRRLPSLTLSQFEAIRHEDDAVAEEDEFAYRHTHDTPIDDPSESQWESEAGVAAPKPALRKSATPSVGKLNSRSARKQSVSSARQQLQPQNRFSSRASSASYNDTSAAVGDGKKAPLVLLHITLLFLPGAEGAILRKITPTMLERGLLVEHPRGDYQLLEELIIDALGLDEPPATAGSEEDEDSEDEWEKSLGVRRVKAKNKWELRVYAANGLMTPGAWKRVWSEMERVDVEVGPKNWRARKVAGAGKWTKIFAEGKGRKDVGKFVSPRIGGSHGARAIKFWFTLGAVVVMLLTAFAGLYHQYGDNIFAATDLQLQDTNFTEAAELVLPDDAPAAAADIDAVEIEATPLPICGEDSAEPLATDSDDDTTIITSSSFASSSLDNDESKPESPSCVPAQPADAESEQAATTEFSEGAAETTSAEGWWGWKKGASSA
ncbi:hypothetical protein FN846DRAFT_231733 [Sphaerosporella brunnea]|uniref:Uncharacterized protein n=1 Tax=Sphaerosporella brunnea TaxID=1250544 RepID=A0A5J5ENG0_9PEZI|nr:hypothetical protein FN846DRAFT_231733 [Sphaerosporella brunnea]